MTRRDSISFGATLSLMGVFFFGVWILLNPANPISRLFQAKISDTDAQVIVGPYPSEDDFRRLKANGVTLIVSLLDPRLPYERILLAREQDVAAQQGLRLVDFPMSSVLGIRFGDDYTKNAKAAAAAIAAEVANDNGKVFLHCYLGIHRVKTVQEILPPQRITAAKYKIHEGERSRASVMLDQAQASFEHARYAEAVAYLDQIPHADVAAQTLYGWSFFKLGNTASARAHFMEAVQLDPDNTEAHVGLGYVALRDNDLETANHEFAGIPESARDGQTLVGLGLVQFRQGRLAEAEVLLRAALAKDPANADAQALLATISEKK